MATPEEVRAGVQQKHPEWRVVSVMPAPGGGWWGVGEDGGVFTLDDTGAASGATPFLGSYGTLDPVHRNDPNRRFTGIVANDRYGYDLLTKNPNERYSFAGSAPQNENRTPIPGAPGGPPVPGKIGNEVDIEEAGLRRLLEQAGLSDLFREAWPHFKGEAGGDYNITYDWLVTTPTYKAKFPAMEWLRQNNQPIKNEAQYLAYTQEVSTAMTRAGIPADFWNEPEDFAKFMRNGWSVEEVQGAVGMAQQAVLSMPADMRETMSRYWGINNGDLTAWYLDPDKKGGDLIQRKAQTAIANVGSTVGRSAFGALTREESEGLFRSGVEADAAAGVLAGANPLLAETAAEERQGTDLTRRTALEAAGSQTGAAAQQLLKRRQSRQSAFEGGGGGVTGGAGTTGLGGKR